MMLAEKYAELITKAFGQADPVIPPHLRVYRSDLQLLSASGEKLDNPVMGRANAVNQVVENQ